MPRTPTADHPQPTRYGLGLDVGGTQTRWALADISGDCAAQGVLPGFTGVMLATPEGSAAVAQVLQALRVALGGRPVLSVCAGVTGTDAAAGQALRTLMGQVLGLQPGDIELASDIEMACRAAFAPGGGYLVYAGTGSIAGFIDAQGVFHRAGGRGHLIDDAGSGHWIATQALRTIWRAEDAQPGAWRHSAMARRVLAMIGGGHDEAAAERGADWACCRQWVAQASRGDMGQLARAVAGDGLPPDATAQALLRQAGTALAPLGQALIARYGPRPVALAGRVFLLSPLIEQALRAALPPEIAVHAMAADVALAAAQRAAQRAARHPA
jgi:N-acetylglucosamine kinase-like BadF-type ATPase